MFSSCFHFFCNEEELDYDLCDSNSIVEITLQRDFFLLKLQELVDSTNFEQAERAIRAMDEASSPDDHRLLKFLVRAGTITILEDVLQRHTSDESPSLDVAGPLLAKLAKYQIRTKQRKIFECHMDQVTRMSGKAVC